MVRLFLALLILAPTSAVAGSPPDSLPEIRHGTVAAVTDGMSFVLADGTPVRLAGIDAPLPPLGRKLTDDFPLARTVRGQLADLVLNREVSLRGREDLDRYGRLVVQAVRDDGAWVEGVLLATGAVRVETSAEHRELAAAMLALEAGARDRQLGLWRSFFYAVRGPAGLEHASGRFVIVEARVAASAKLHGALELSFAGGDLTARLAHPAAALFADAGIDPASLAGTRIRLRGWVSWAGHPSIELTHPEQIERLAPNSQ